jgi:uncharacterized protein with GYD domain
LRQNKGEKKGGKGRVIKNQTEKGEKAIKTKTKRQKRVKKLT